jgi:LysR family hydrogen peroxide-inducible transcriptional activator
VAAETRHGQIVVRRFAAPPPHRTLALVWRRRSSFGAVLAPLAATLRAAYAAAAAEPERPRAVAKAR